MWEYMKLKDLRTKQLDELGKEGWELVSHNIIHFENFSYRKHYEIYIFKRKKS